MVSLLENLSQESQLLLAAGTLGLSQLMEESDSLLNDLEMMEASLLEEVESGIQQFSSLTISQPRMDSWYKQSILGLKVYNNGLSKFTKSVILNPQYHKDMDDAYLYKLIISDAVTESGAHSDDSHCKREGHNPCFNACKLENHEQLQKAIYLHMLKTGHSGLVRRLVDDPENPGSCAIEQSVILKFDFLGQVLEDIRERHDLTLALKWFEERHASSGDLSNDPANADLDFKLHVLQFVLLLGDNDSLDGPPNMNNLLNAYKYSQNNFNRFFHDYLDVIKPLTTLFLRRYGSFGAAMNGTCASNSQDPYPDLWKDIDGRSKVAGNLRGTEFVQEVLSSFEGIHQNHALFSNLVDEFTKAFCKDMNLSSESSLFQTILAGFVFMPSFHKYNSIERRLSASREKTLADGPYPIGRTATEVSDLPFQLPDGPRFLFHHHPIFTCPISKEQLSPMSRIQLHEIEHRISPNTNDSPLVVLNFCQHVALRESVWHLSKKGTDVFKCHYCYKRHKYLDVTNARFIDL